jgi:hypothetical protein
MQKNHLHSNKMCQKTSDCAVFDTKESQNGTANLIKFSNTKLLNNGSFNATS